MTLHQFAIESDSRPTAPQRPLYPDDGLERERSKRLINDLFFVIPPSANGTARGLVVPLV